VCCTGLTGVKPLSGSCQLSPAGTGLTGGAHRLAGVGQWTRGLVFRCVPESEGCVLVPMSSGTPVAMWSWPIWVVSRRHVLEAVFIVLEFPSPSRRIFIGSHSLPLSGSPYRSFRSFGGNAFVQIELAFMNLGAPFRLNFSCALLPMVSSPFASP
jgi:hypothetical protein